MRVQHIFEKLKHRISVRLFAYRKIESGMKVLSCEIQHIIILEDTFRHANTHTFRTNSAVTVLCSELSFLLLENSK